jgi:hypothetical protein
MNRALIIAACLAVFCAPLHSREEKFQGQYSRQDLEKGIVKYAKVRRTGLIIGVAGLTLVAVGAVLAATADYPTDDDASGEKGNPGVDPQAVIGIFAIPVGVGIAVTGLVFRIIGTQKKSNYEGMLEAISLRYQQNGDRRALGLAYRF